MANPCCKDGVVYPSQAAMARALGRSQYTVYWALKTGSIDRLGLGAQVWPSIAVRDLSGRVFPSLGEAARVHGLSKARVHQLVAAGRRFFKAEVA